MAAANISRSGRKEISTRGSWVHKRNAENPRRLMFFLMRRSMFSGLRNGVSILDRRGRRLNRRLGLDQTTRFTVIVEYFRVAAPVHGCFELALDFVFGEVFVKDIVKEFVGDRVVRFALEDA